MSGSFGSSQWMYASGGEEVTQQSLKFNDDESQYLSWTPATAGNRKTWTWSGWVKRGSIGVTQAFFSSGATSPNYSALRFLSSDVLQLFVGGAASYFVTTTAVYRDASAWYHINFAFDVTQATASNRCKLYVNGVQQTLTGTYPTNSNWEINNTYPHSLGSMSVNSTFLNPFDGYLSDVHFVDGQALDPTSFGQFTNGYWEKIDYAGTYGTNGFHLTFADDVVSEGFNAVTYSGNGGTQSISGLGLAADLVWVKERTSTSNHVLTDTVRGAGPILSSNATNAENAGAGQYLQSFDGDGFTIGNSGAFNAATDTYVAWAWDAGSGSPVSNTDGTITSTVKSNPDYGFSIASYTGNNGSSGSFGHGLGVAPNMVIIKSRTDAANWAVGHDGLTSWSYYIALNSTAAEVNDSANFNGTAPTSTVVNIGGSGNTNDAENYIAYCFSEVAGYSSIGSYTGNGSTSGAVVTTNFNTALLLVKRTDTTGNWFIWDNTRDTDGVFNTNIHPNSSAAEAASGSNFVTPSSTGFQLTGTGAETNASGGTYIYMAFADTREAAFWKDVSGQGNHWTPNNLDYRDSLPDSPANNFAVSNPLDAESFSFAEGNLKVISASTTWTTGRSSIAVSGGKWYWEVQINEQAGSDVRFMLGIEAVNIDLPSFVGYTDSDGYGYFHNSGDIYHNNINTSGNATYTLDDVIGIALDLDAGTLSFYKNGTLQPQSFSSVSGTFTPAMSLRRVSGTACAAVYNFGQDSTFAGARPMGAYTDDSELGAFQYQPPAGFKSLCTANLPEPTIVDGSEHFNTVAYTGTGATNSVTVGFAPDFTWIKQRNTTRDHQLLDIVRGYTNNILYSNLTNAEDISVTARIDSRDVDGFTVNTPTQVNQSGGTYAAWNWKAGGTAVSNTDGSVTTQVSANPDAGFSICTYTAAGVNTSMGHGLNQAPELMIAKIRNAAFPWYAHTTAIDGTLDTLNLNTTAAAVAAGQNAPTSTLFYNNITASYDWVTYCFHSVEGFSKVGSYTGNGSSTDGTFVYTGFRPAWILTKVSSTTENWRIHDTKREGYNVDNNGLYPNLTNAETTSDFVDILSNGFKWRINNGSVNGSGQTYIYLAFAENPFKYANAR